MSNSKKHLAFLAYLLSIFGWLYIILFRRKENFAVYHAKQSIIITIIAGGSFAAWALIAWSVSLIPFFGFIFAVVLFTFIVAIYIFLAVLSIIGMLYSLQGKKKPLPIVGVLAK